MAASRIGVASLLLLAWGCGSDGKPPTRKGPNPEAFCAALAVEACEGQTLCCLDAEEREEDCLERATSYCMEWADYRAYEANAVALSHTEYRPDLAQALLDEAEEAFSSCAYYRAPLGNVFFAPRLSVGDRCLDSVGCPSGTFCHAETEESGVCRPPSGRVGELCDELGGSGWCEGGLVCGPDDRCMERLALGEACQDPEHCESGICSADNVCGTCIERDNSCEGGECERWCPFSLVCEASNCVEPKPTRELGDACESDAQCASGICSGTCLSKEPPSSAIPPYCQADVLVPPLWT